MSSDHYLHVLTISAGTSLNLVATCPAICVAWILRQSCCSLELQVAMIMGLVEDTRWFTELLLNNNLVNCLATETIMINHQSSLGLEQLTLAFDLLEKVCMGVE